MLIRSAGTGSFGQADFQITLQAAVGFCCGLLVTEAQFDLIKSAASFRKGQGWHLNPFQLRKSTFSSAIVEFSISTFRIPTSLTSDFRIPTSAFRLPTSLTSAFRIPHSAFRLPTSLTSDFRIPLSAFRIPHSAFDCPIPA
jgi:hypothetical protein